MSSPIKFSCFCSLIFPIISTLTTSQQSYDKSSCNSQSQTPISRYLCNSDTTQCDTFLVYRAQKNFDTLSVISPLFNRTPSDILPFNNDIDSDSTSLERGREIIIPISCQCRGSFYQAIVGYNLSGSDTFAHVACGVFEGLAKAQSLFEENPDNVFNPVVSVPLKCACPSANQTSKCVNNLVTYPIVENDRIPVIASKFSVSEEMLRDANKLGRHDTIFPKTTLLIPTKDIPSVNLSIGSPPISPPGPRPVTPTTRVTTGAQSDWNSNVFLGAGAFMSVLAVSWGIVCIKKRVHPTSSRPYSTESLALENIGPEFFNALSELKLCLINYSLEELRKATNSFDESCKLGAGLYRGSIGGSCVAIEKLDSNEAAGQAACVLTKINHFNIVKLRGWSNGSKPYLVYEFPAIGSLRHCLSNEELGKQLTWTRRKHIAFDLAVALHYLHYCTTPPIVHRNFSSANVLVTTDWRAKICGFNLLKQVVDCEDHEDSNWNESVIVGTEDYLAPMHITKGHASFKMDVYAFGVVLLELLSAKEVNADGKGSKLSIKFNAEGRFERSSEFLEKLKEFMDPVLQGDYILGDVIILELLGKACIEEDPQRRPTMNDILKTLSRML